VNYVPWWQPSPFPTQSFDLIRGAQPDAPLTGDTPVVSRAASGEPACRQGTVQLRWRPSRRCDTSGTITQPHAQPIPMGTVG